ncbi:MAG: ABC transporter ATP-binding protein/permease [Synergistales bacterium]|nr:ABC transporter ATP-binding protein/permease [Synergistales bacterium]
MILASVCGILPPWILKNVVDEVLIGKDLAVLNMLAVAMVVLYFLKALFTFGQRYLMTWAGQRVILDLRVRLYDHVQRMSLRYINGRRVGELISRVTNDVNVLQDVVTRVAVELVVQCVTVVGMLGFLVYINWKLALVALAVMPGAALLINVTSKKLRKVGHEIQEQVANLASLAQQAIASLRIVHAFATEDQELERFRIQNNINFRALMRGTRLDAALGGAVEVVVVIALSIILWLGGRFVVEGALTPGELIAFLGYLGLLVHPIRIVARSIGKIQQGLASGDRIFSLLDSPSEIASPRNAVTLPRLSGEIRFQNVHFAYESEQWVLSGVDLHVRAGETVAIVGVTGSGKSTLADMVPRFFDPQIGGVSVDGYDLRDVDLHSLRRQIGIVPQDPVLLKGSIGFNIGYGLPEVRSEQLEEAARIAGIHEFIASLPRGYLTEVGERGVTLSGGQRQRIAIARAIIRDPAILILDEATSSLDAAVEVQIQSAMQKATEERTSLVIAHRLSTVRGADRIVVLQEGAVIEEGTHGELMRCGGVYNGLYRLQLGHAEEAETEEPEGRKGVPTTGG